MPLPTQLLLTFATGVLTALAARSDLRVTPKSVLGSRAFLAYMLYAVLVLLPVSGYFYLFHGDWFLLYLIDTDRIPSAVALLGSFAQAGLGALGFLTGGTLIRSQREQWAWAAWGAALASGLGFLPLVQERLNVVGTYVQFHGDFGLRSYRDGLLQSTLWMAFWLLAGLVVLLYRLGPGAKRG